MKITKLFSALFFTAATMTAAHAGAHSDGLCATVYQGPHATGAALQILDGSEIADLGQVWMEGDRSWDNKVTSATVQPGCGLIVYQYQNFGVNYYTGEPIGWHHVIHNTRQFAEHQSFRGTSVDNRASSLTCVCH